MSFVGVLLMWSAMQHPEATARAQQPTGYSHRWGQSLGSLFNDEGRGVAVSYDGTVVHASASFNYGLNDETFPMTLIRRHEANGDVRWTVPFSINGWDAGFVVPHGVAVPDPGDDGGRAATAYVVGKYSGEVQFGGWGTPGNALDDQSYVAEVFEPDLPGPPTADVVCLTIFSGGRNAALAVAAGRVPKNCTEVQGQAEGFIDKRVVVGGFFSGTVYFGSQNTELTAVAGEDGYVATVFRGSCQGGARSDFAFAIGGPGNQRVTALAIDDRTGELLVAGWFDNPLTDFDPGTATVTRPWVGGRDLFVARYRRAASWPEPPTLVWVYTFGTAYDDEASCLALGVDDDSALTTLAFVGGWRTTSLPEGHRDAIFAAVRPGFDPRFGEAKWLYNPQADGDERVLAVAADGLGRPVFTGHFGCPTDPGAPPCMGIVALDFDPHETNVLTIPHQGLDAFVVRYHPTEVQTLQGADRPKLDWAYKVGGNFDESATAIAFDPACTDRFALTGWFGKPDAAPGQYSINLDPAGVAPPVTSAGFADSFLAVQGPATPLNVGFQISLVIDNSCAWPWQPLPPFQVDHYADLMRHLRDLFNDPNVLPYPGQVGPGGVRQLAVQVNAVLATANPVRVDDRHLEARVAMPWTVIDPTTAPLFARQLSALARFDHGEVSARRVPDGLRLAAQQTLSSGVDPALSQSALLYIGHAPESWGAVMDARNEVALRFDRACALGVGNATRANLLLNLAVPTVIGGSALDIDRQSIGFVGHALDVNTGGAFGFRDTLGRMLRRLGWCPSNFDLDLCVSQGQDRLDLADEQAWTIANQLQSPVADWNFDGQFDAAIDLLKLRQGLPAPPSSSCGCP